MTDNKIVQSEVQPLSRIFSEKYVVDFFQREYVWQKKHLEDLLMDLSTEFLKCWTPGDDYEKVANYDPYFMGEIVVSLKDGGRYSIIDGQQRLTTFTLLLIYLMRKYKSHPDFPMSDVEPLIRSNHFGKKRFNLEIEERQECMKSLLEKGEYLVKDNDSVSVKNIVDIYECIDELWNEKIDGTNVIHFVYWLLGNVMFSKVWTNSDEFAYVIFETMNDRGLSLTQVEMLRSYILANISEENRTKAMDIFGDMISNLTSIKLTSKSKAEFEFFKTYLRGHYANDPTQTKSGQGDFERIGKDFHRWIRDNTLSLNLIDADDYWDFLQKLAYFAKTYKRIYTLIQERDTVKNLYLTVNYDYGFTLQPQLILAAINENDDDETVEEKIQLISKYLTKVLTWRVWNHWAISQSALETPIYELCKLERGKDVEELRDLLETDPIQGPILENYPVLNQQNRRRMKVLLSLITEIVSANSGSPDYMLNKTYKVDIEHIWANHFEQHTDEFASEDDFASVRNSIGDLLVLPKSFNSSYGDKSYEDKMPHYYEQNVLAQSLCKMKYENNPGFLQFKNSSQLNFKYYDSFKRSSIGERGELYKSILKWNWNIDEEEYADQKNQRAKEVYKLILDWAAENEEIMIDVSDCSTTYIRFTSSVMNMVFPHVENSEGWKNGSNYFYEIYNKTGSSAKISLTVGSKNLPEEYRVIADKINALYAKKKKMNWTYLHVFNTGKHKYGYDINKDSVYIALNECWKEVHQFENEIKALLNL